MRRPGDEPGAVRGAGGGVTGRAADRGAGCEPWLDKRAVAAHFACSVRSIEAALADGCPHATIFGRRKFRASEVEPWLEQHGYLERRRAA